MSASMALNALRAREVLYRNVRDFFLSQQFSSPKIVEIETALFSAHELPPQSTVLPIKAMQQRMASGSGAVFQISKQYREEMIDRRHHTEFTVLHWSQPDWTLDQILLNLDAFLQAIFSGEFEPERRTFRQSFIQRLGFDPDVLSATDLWQEARRLGLNASLGENRLAWLKLMFVHFIEPTLGIDIPLYLTDLPSQWRDTLHDGEVRLNSHVDIFIDGIKVGSVLSEIFELSKQSQQNCIYQHVIFGSDRLLMIILETRKIEKVMSVLGS